MKWRQNFNRHEVAVKNLIDMKWRQNFLEVASKFYLAISGFLYKDHRIKISGLFERDYRIKDEYDQEFGIDKCFERRQHFWMLGVRVFVREC